MNFKTIILYIIALFLISCNNKKKYVPNGLTKLTEKQLIENTQNKISIDFESIIFKNEKGEIISLDSVRNIPNMEEFTSDRYIDKAGVIKEMVIRKATQKDKDLLAKLQQVINENQYANKQEIQLIDIDCDKKAEILEEIHALDQDMRQEGNKKNYDPNIDRQNLIKVVSLIEKCGMPSTKEISNKQMHSIWLVFQHGDNTNRKKYLPLLKKAAKNGDLRKSNIALMEDRILMMDGKPQIYGSQISQDHNTKKWIIHTLEAPEFVDKR